MKNLSNKAIQLKDISIKLEREIEETGKELGKLQQIIQSSELELSLIRDAINIKFPNLQYKELEELKESINNVQIIQELEKQFETERSKTKWLQEDINKMKKLLPTQVNTEFNLEEIQVKYEELKRKYQKLHENNENKIKKNKNSQEKYQILIQEIENLEKHKKQLEIQERKKEERIKEKENIQEENEGIIQNIREENESIKYLQEEMKTIQNELKATSEYLEEHEETAKHLTTSYDILTLAYAELDQSNLKEEEIKSSKKHFEEESETLLMKMNSQINNINSLIEQLKMKLM